MKRHILSLITFIALSTNAQPISIEQYRMDVERYSWSIRSAKEQRNISEQEELISLKGFLPKLSLSGDFSLSLRNKEGIKPWAFSLSPEIVGSLYEGGAQRAAYSLAKINHTISLYGEELTLSNVRYAADYAYWNLSATRLYELATARYVELIRSLKLVIDNRFKEGYISKSDVLMIESRLASAEYEYLSAEENYLRALHHFNILRGVDSDSKVELSSSILDSLSIPERQPIRQILIHSPTYNTSRLAIDQAKYGLKIERSKFNPRVEIGARAIWQPDSPNINGSTDISPMIFARLSIPIFHFRERHHRLNAAQAEVREREWQLAEVFDKIVQDERDGWSSLMQSLSQIQTTGENLRIAAENLELSTYSYGQGIASILDVMQAQLNWIQLYTNAITARFNFAIARSAYQRITLYYD